MSCTPDYQISKQLRPVALVIRFAQMNFPIVAADESVCDGVDSSSAGTRVHRAGRRLRLPRFGGATYADDCND
jgi:hypothetical protein